MNESPAPVVPTRRAGGGQVIPRPDAWRPGPPAPWRDGTVPTLDRVLAAVPAVSRPVHPTFADARPSAVLITLTEGDLGPEVLLTRRSLRLTHHRGEICFPGGRLDGGETPLDAALREAREEVALEPELVAVHGELEHLATVVSRSYIVPKVATVAERPALRAHPHEVDRVFWVPLAELTRPDTYRAERWGDPPADRVLHFFELDDETIWGATAHMLVDLLARSLA